MSSPAMTFSSPYTSAIPSPTEMTVPTSSTSTPCVTPASWALMSWVIS